MSEGNASSSSSSELREEKSSVQIEDHRNEEKEETVENSNEEEEKEKIVVKKQVVHHNYNCECQHVPELTRSELEERIRRIREELNLPQTSVKEDLRHRDYHVDHHHSGFHQNCIDESKRTKWVSSSSEADDRVFRSRSKSASERWLCWRSKSKSPGRNVSSAKPAWRPTGANDYTSTYLRRADMIINSEKKKASVDVRPSTSMATTSLPVSLYLITSSITITIILKILNSKKIFRTRKNFKYSLEIFLIFLKFLIKEIFLLILFS